MARELIALLLLVCTVVVINAQNNYCNIQSCQRKGYKQTMCEYPSNQPGRNCLQRGDQGSGLTGAEKQAIVNRHNELRQLVARGGERRGKPGPQPPARSMPNLRWDNELAMVAQRWADQCIWAHDGCRDVSRFNVGQNIAWQGTTGNPASIPVLVMVDNWYNEVKDFDRSVVSRYRSTGEKIGHYTQMVWGTTTTIGCGLRNYYDGGYNKKYLVCNYGPGGNMLGAPVYQT